MKSRRVSICLPIHMEHSFGKLLIQGHNEFLHNVKGNYESIDSPDPYSKYSSNFDQTSKTKSSCSSSNFSVKLSRQCSRYDNDEKSSENLMNTTIRKNFMDKIRNSPLSDLSPKMNTNSHISPKMNTNSHIILDTNADVNDIFRQTVSPFKSNYDEMIDKLRLKDDTDVVQSDNKNTHTNNDKDKENINSKNNARDSGNNNNKNDDHHLKYATNENIIFNEEIKSKVGKDIKLKKNNSQGNDVQSPEGFPGFNEINNGSQEEDSFSRMSQEQNLDKSEDVKVLILNKKNIYENNKYFQNIEFIHSRDNVNEKNVETENNIEKESKIEKMNETLLTSSTKSDFVLYRNEIENNDIDTINFIKNLRRRKSEMTFNDVAGRSVRKLSTEYLLDEILENANEDIDRNYDKRKDKNEKNLNCMHRKEEEKEMKIELTKDNENEKENLKRLEIEKEQEKESFIRSTRIMKPSPPIGGLKIKNEIKSRLSPPSSVVNILVPPNSMKSSGKKLFLNCE